MFAPALLALAAFVPTAFGTVYVTAPVSETSWAAGQNQSISWQDDGSTPSLADFGNAKVSIYVGNANVQTEVQQIVPSVNVSTTQSIVFTPNPAAGANGDYYFIRFESLALKDAKNPQYPAEAFSAKFSLSGMSGSFNASVQSEIDGQSTAPIGGSTSVAATSVSTHAAVASLTSTPASSTHAPSSTASAAGAANGAASLAVGGFTGVAAVAVALVGAMLL
ncbi:hypothetical protein AcW1_002570 [Taiwanofungus camphoratus]|nr:hypothetical protein AcW1_002570 [Antrodia cinnamomea]